MICWQQAINGAPAITQGAAPGGNVQSLGEGSGEGRATAVADP